MSATFDVEVPVVTSGLRPRALSTQIVRGQITRRIHFDDVNPENAPLVATVKGIALRMHAGQFYAQIGNPLAGQPWKIAPYSGHFYAFVDRLGYSTIDNRLIGQIGKDRIVCLTKQDGVSLLDLESARIREMDEALVREQLETFEKAAMPVIVVEGALLMPVGEPRICLSGLFYQHSCSLELRASGTEMRDLLLTPNSLFGIYPLCRLDEVVARVQRMPGLRTTDVGFSDRSTIEVYQPGAFTERFLQENAAMFARRILSDLYDRRLRSAGQSLIQDLLALGMERLQEVDRLDTGLNVFLNGGPPDDLVEVVESIIERCDDDPIWRGFDEADIERRQFLRDCYDNEPVGLMLG